MYWTPCARLMKSMTPNTRVSPAAMRKSSTPSWSPLRVWTRRRPVDMPAVRSPDGAKRNPGSASPHSASLLRATTISLHRAILDVGVGVVREHLLHDLGLELAVRTLGDLDEVE